MKVRTDFVTNSSSSSFIIVSHIDMCDELIEYMKEEYGKYGVRLINDLVKPLYVDDYMDTCDAIGFFLSESQYKEMKDNFHGCPTLISRHITCTTDGDSNGDDAWLRDKIPKKFILGEIQTNEDTF